MKKLALFGCGCAALIACATKVESGDILTSGMYADIGARSLGDGTTSVSATLYLGNPSNRDYIDLVRGDQLRASNGGEAKVMIESSVLNVVRHDAEFQTDNGGDEFVVDFIREVDDGAPESVATLPAGFDVTPVSAPVSRAQGLTIDWTPASPDQMSWVASGECVDPVSSFITDDTGSVVIGANTFKKAQGTQVADSCMVTVTITRKNLGVLDIHYGRGGSVVGEQVRTVTFMSTP